MISSLTQTNLFCYSTQWKPFVSKISRRLLISYLCFVDRLIHISNERRFGVFIKGTLSNCQPIGTCTGYGHFPPQFFKIWVLQCLFVMNLLKQLVFLRQIAVRSFRLQSRLSISVARIGKLINCRSINRFKLFQLIISEIKPQLWNKSGPLKGIYISAYKVYFFPVVPRWGFKPYVLARKNTGDKFSKKTDETAFRYRVKSINLYANHAAIDGSP